MSGPFYDNFTTGQGYPGPGSSTPIIDDGSWAPNSSRTVFVNSTNTIYITSGTVNIPPATSGITYSSFLPSPQDLSTLQTVNFGESSAGNSLSLTISIIANYGTITRTVGSTGLTINTTPQTISVDINNLDGVLSSAISISIIFTLQNSGSGSIASIGAFSSTFTCVAHDSLITTLMGEKFIQDLQRGDEIIGGKIARVIRTEMHPRQIVEAIIFPPSCLEKNVPNKQTIVCSEHYFIYKDKRRLAKCFLAFPGVKLLKGKAIEILPLDEEGKAYFYDIQFDHEGEYIVNGMISQSRSPYALVSLLPKELYFHEENYKEERVKNTLCIEPVICTKYILPDGGESETFYKLVPKDKCNFIVPFSEEKLSR